MDRPVAGTVNFRDGGGLQRNVLSFGVPRVGNPAQRPTKAMAARTFAAVFIKLSLRSGYCGVDEIREKVHGSGLARQAQQ